MAVSLKAQNGNAIAITYHSVAHISSSDILPPYPDTSGMKSEDIAEELEIYEELKLFALREAQKTNDVQDVSVYTIFDSRVRCERTSYRLSDDEFRLTDLSENKSYTYFTKKGVPELMTSSIHDTANNWEVSYQIDTFRNDRKNILGYDCYRMIIEEHRIWASEGFDEIREYDLYVTDQLPLPFRAVGVFWQPVIELCALEAVIRNPKLPQSLVSLTATRIQTNVSPEVLKIPRKYRHLKE